MLDNNPHKKAQTKSVSIAIDIDENSGFCFGVINAIKKAEDHLSENSQLLCLGNIVHNEEEVARLKSAGLNSINKADFENLKDSKVLFRAHGEPPQSYQLAKNKNIQIIDATCPVVLKLQKRIKQAWLDIKDTNGQVVIYGKKGHAEVQSLVGQTNGEAIVIESEEEINTINSEQAVVVFSQTTKSIEKYQQLGEKIKNWCKSSVKIHDTICRQVANRAPKLKQFVKNYDLIVFVGGQSSSNAKYLYGVCKSINNNTHFVSSANETQNLNYSNITKIGICGATSTPLWLMEQVKNEIEKLLSQN